MKKTANNLIIAILSAGMLLSFPGPVLSLSHSSDRISLSGPGVYANHTITFRLTENIDPGGNITITPESGFFVQSGFDWTDIDIAVATTTSGPYLDREVGPTASSTADGAAVVASTTNGSVSITLNSASGLNAGDYVQIELGTNASYGENGDRQIVNPDNTTDYNISIYTYDSAGRYLERSNVKVYIIHPVNMGTEIRKSRSHGSPIGWLANGTTQTILSIQTNFEAYCRYSTASNTPYDSMEGSFNYLTASSGQFLHTVMVTGLENGAHYEYFVRCEDDNGTKDDYTLCVYDNASTTPFQDASGTPILELDCLDYPIPFAISSIPGATGDDTGDGSGGDGEAGDDDGDSDDDGSTSETSGDGDESGGGSGPGSGGGSGGGFGRGRGNYLPYPPPPGSPGVILEGYAYPSVEVTVLKDGVEQGLVLSDTQAVFGAFLEELNQGVFTFSLWAQDSAGRRSSTYSTTFWIDAGTQTTVSDIIIPPTLSMSAESVDIGGVLRAEGMSVPGQTIEVWMYPSGGGSIEDDDIVKTSGVVSSDGSWSLLLDTDSMAGGAYKVKGKTVMDIGESEFSQALDLSIGADAPEGGLCEGADLNQDGRVNIIDFSILLYYWGTNNECADQNKSGNVDLIDFSIMMFYWTG